MKHHLSAIAIATLAALAASAAQAQSGPEFRFSGYGTIGAAHSSEKSGDFIGDIFQPKGAGKTDSWSFNPDTKLGLQANAKFNDKLSAVVQVVSKNQYDNSYTPQVEWANVKYQPFSSLDIRLGRIAAPSYLLSESRFVGYASAWVRPPQEVYGVLAITSNDGVDATWRSQIGSANNSVQAFYGSSTAKLTTGKAKANSSWGINDSVEIGSFQLRAGYNALDIDIETPSLDALFGGLKQFAAGANSVPVPSFQAAGAQALALVDKYKLESLKLSAIALGAAYDPGNWFVSSEFVDFKGDGLLSNSRSWYVSAGMRLGTFTPYASYQSTKADIKAEAGISAAGAAPLAAGAAGLTAGINATLKSFTPKQNSTSVGLRWDFAKNVAAKIQYDHISVGEGSNGRLRVPQGQSLANRSINVASVAVDFVF
jgi:hypothetical protein